MTTETIVMTYFEQYMQHRALSFKFSTAGSSLGQIEKLVGPEGLDQISGVKLQNVCAKLAQPLVDRLDQALSVLDMTKRDFIELALIEALDKVDAILDETNAFEFVDARSEQEGK